MRTVVALEEWVSVREGAFGGMEVLGLDYSGGI